MLGGLAWGGVDEREIPCFVNRLLSLTLMSHLSRGLSLFWAEQGKTNGNALRSRDGQPGTSFPCFFEVVAARLSLVGGSSPRAPLQW